MRAANRCTARAANRCTTRAASRCRTRAASRCTTRAASRCTTRAASRCTTRAANRCTTWISDVFATELALISRSEANRLPQRGLLTTTKPSIFSLSLPLSVASLAKVTKLSGLIMAAASSLRCAGSSLDIMILSRSAFFRITLSRHASYPSSTHHSFIWSCSLHQLLSSVTRLLKKTCRATSSLPNSMGTETTSWTARRLLGPRKLGEPKLAGN
jgi:hypothetical protein